MLICFSSAFSQDSSSTPKPRKLHRADYSSCGHNYIITAAYHAAKYSSAEISFSRGYTWSSGGFPGSFSQYGAGMEFFRHNKEIIYAPKISCELDPFMPPLCLSRMNLMYVTDFRSHESLKYRHEIGISIMGYGNITYSYTWNITHDDFLPVKHGISFQWNLPLGKRGCDNAS
jgi:hypothetical protein